MTLGMTNGTNNYSFGGSNTTGFCGNASEYGKPYSSSTPTSSTASLGRNTSYGVTMDSTKSGIVANLSGINIGNVNSLKLGKYIIKY